jgi:hypothetical protein
MKSVTHCTTCGEVRSIEIGDAVTIYECQCDKKVRKALERELPAAVKLLATEEAYKRLEAKHARLMNQLHGIHMAMSVKNGPVDLDGVRCALFEAIQKAEEEKQ